ASRQDTRRVARYSLRAYRQKMEGKSEGRSRHQHHLSDLPRIGTPRRASHCAQRQQMTLPAGERESVAIGNPATTENKERTEKTPNIWNNSVFSVLSVFSVVSLLSVADAPGSIA